jgi:hypothetical protein
MRRSVHVTAYQLALGYIQLIETEDGSTRRRLWMEHETYHVLEVDCGCRVFWYSTRKLGDARRWFRSPFPHRRKPVEKDPCRIPLDAGSAFPTT